MVLQLSNDGRKSGLFLGGFTTPALDQKYFAQVDNVYVIELANVMVPGFGSWERPKFGSRPPPS